MFTRKQIGWAPLLTLFMVGCAGDPKTDDVIGIVRIGGEEGALESKALSVDGRDDGLAAPAGSLYVAFCRQEGTPFSCHSFLMKFDSTRPTGINTVALPRVDQAVRARAPTVKAAVVDPRRGLAYLHGGCTGTYIVTNLRSGTSWVFPTPGIQCLQELIYDQAKDRVVAIGGSAISGGSAIDAVVSLSPDGRVTSLFNIRAQVPRDFTFLHPFKELVSFDTKRRVASTSLFRIPDPGGPRSLLNVNVDTGAVRITPWVAGVQNQFYDAVTDATYGFDYARGGIRRVDSFSPIQFTTIVNTVFCPLTPAEVCTTPFPGANFGQEGFIGADFDPVSLLHFVLFRKRDLFYLGTSDLRTRRLLGFPPTGDTARTFRHATIPPITFFSVQYVPPLR